MSYILRLHDKESVGRRTRHLASLTTTDACETVTPSARTAEGRAHGRPDAEASRKVQIGQETDIRRRCRRALSVRCLIRRFSKAAVRQG